MLRTNVDWLLVMLVEFVGWSSDRVTVTLLMDSSVAI